MNLQGDLDLLFTDFAEVVTFGATTFKCIFDSPDKSLLDGRALSTDYQILCKTSDVVSVVEENVLNFRAQNYTVRFKELIDDGLLTRIYLGVA